MVTSGSKGAVLERGRRAVRGALQPGRRAALAAAVGCAAYGALKLYWSLGGDLLVRQAPLPADDRRDLLEGTGTLTVLDWASVALAAIGIALAVATVRDRRLPRLLVVGLPALIGVFMLARAALGAAGDVAVLTGAADAETHTENWDLALWSPFFAAWGAAWGLAALAARRRTAGRPRGHARRPPSPRRDDLSTGRLAMATSILRRVRVAAGIVCAVFTAFVVIHLLWAVGVTWGLDEVSAGQWEPDDSGLTAASLVGAAAGAAAIFVTLGRVGWLQTPLSDRLLHIGAWVVFAWPAIGTLNPASSWGQRAVALPLAIAALVVARSHPRPPAREASRPTGTGTPVAH